MLSVRYYSSLRYHLAAISPYSEIFRHPPTPKAGEVKGAVYLFRHGVLEVSHHDYTGWIVPFLQKLHSLQTMGGPFVSGRLSFLSSYQSWITDAHVGMLSHQGFRECANLGRAFRRRYSQWLIPKAHHHNPTLCVWTDDATRCRLSAVTFANAFAGIGGESIGTLEQIDDDRLQQVESQVRVLRSERGSRSCDNLCWHNAFSVDQDAGSDEFKELMEVTTRSAYERLKNDWAGPVPLQARDIYAMQLLHCYDVVSERSSPIDTCFTSDDWVGFEYLRDAKYHFSEGYGTDYPGFYAIPWLKASLAALKDSSLDDYNLPLRIAFTHREEVLYLCSLLGIGYQKGWRPDLKTIDKNRSWRASTLAPYLGHIGMETYSGSDCRKRIRLVVNGKIRSGFYGLLEQDGDGGYDLDQVDHWAAMHYRAWQEFSHTSLKFLK